MGKLTNSTGPWLQQLCQITNDLVGESSDGQYLHQNNSSIYIDEFCESDAYRHKLNDFGNQYRFTSIKVLDET